MITWNAHDKASKIVLKENNLKANIPGTEHPSVRATGYKSSGKWYFEVDINVLGTTMIGIATKGHSLDTYVGGSYQSVAIYVINGDIYDNGSIKHSSLSAKLNDTYGVMLDSDKKTISFKIGDVESSETKFTYEEVYPCIGNGTRLGDYSETTTNFGATPFKYDVPEGYLPYDYDSSKWWFCENRILLKSKDKFLNVIHNQLNQTTLKEPITDTDMLNEGFKDIRELTHSKDRKDQTMDYTHDFDIFKVYSTTIDRKEYPSIKNMDIHKGE